MAREVWNAKYFLHTEGVRETPAPSWRTMGRQY